MKTPRKDGGLTVVAKRIAPFIDKEVTLRTTWSDSPTEGILVGIEPLGRDYFLLLRVRGRLRYVSTRGVLELSEREEAN